ncbi:CocE/NonD family hydrolase [Litoribrevibacter albus]|uniref:Esterase n=1 Tax=Litoribrevibacter albus TaxID=1473156 RepID=A0AA37S779_9GAMM|nr:CocE/NonD family hydrolase [Litoribrevibacter albus]GLQ29611.1 esterase [Litoribrevibacter albus]
MKKVSMFSALLVSASMAVMPLKSHSADSKWTTSGTRDYVSQPSVTSVTPSTEWQDYDREELYPNTVMTREYVTMPDGTTLAAYVTLPADESGNAIEEAFPTILIISDYNTELGNVLPPKLGTFMGAADPYMVKRGYASVTFDGRGTGNSEGTWDAWGSSQQDYEPIIDWVTAQSWNDGNIGVRGVSDLSINALFAAETGHPAIKAVFALEPIGDAYRDTAVTGGNPNTFFLTWWFTLTTMMNTLNLDIFTNPEDALPLVADHVTDALTEFQLPMTLKAIKGSDEVVYDGEFWETRSPIKRINEIKAPTFLVGAVDDLFQRGVPAMYERLKGRVETKMVILPGTHIEGAFMTTGLIELEGMPAFNQIELQWFDKYLKGMDNGAEDMPQTTQYFKGMDRMAVTTDWPAPEASAQKLYLHRDGKLKENKQPWLSWPRTLVDTGLPNACTPSASQWSLGILGFIPIPCFENNNNAGFFNLLYETSAFDSDYAINGPIQANIWLSQSNFAGSLSVRVDDLDPEGNATPISNGLINLKMRAVDQLRSRELDGERIQAWHPYTKASEKAVIPGDIMNVQLEIFPSSVVLKKGHKLRVAVGPSNLPQGISGGIDGLLQALPGTMTVFNDKNHPSNIIIPTVPLDSMTVVPNSPRPDNSLIDIIGSAL